ncbi:MULTISPECIES: DUF1515 family protein [Rhizobium]
MPSGLLPAGAEPSNGLLGGHALMRLVRRGLRAGYGPIRQADYDVKRWKLIGIGALAVIGIGSMAMG